MTAASAIELDCPSCGKHLKIRSEMAGTRLACPKKGCGARIDVPGEAAKEGGSFRTQLMLLVGVAFAVIAGVLTIRELALDAGWILSLAIVGTIVVWELLGGALKAAASAVFILAGLATAPMFFLLERGQHVRGANAFYIGAALFFFLSLYLVVRTRSMWSQFAWSDSAKSLVNMHSGLVWFSLIASSLAFAWVTYYRFLASFGQEEFLVRRLAFTLFFVVVGVACSVIGRNSALPFLSTMGMVYLAAGVVKALAYDITHTEGVLRIGVFAGCGAVLLLGAFLMKPRRTTANVEGTLQSAFLED